MHYVGDLIFLLIVFLLYLPSQTTLTEFLKYYPQPPPKWYDSIKSNLIYYEMHLFINNLTPNDKKEFFQHVLYGSSHGSDIICEICYIYRFSFL